MPEDIWTYRDSRHLPGGDVDTTGFEVVGRDGTIGVVDSLSKDVSATYIVVDTGDWHPEHQVILPAYTIERIDPARRVVTVDRTRNDITQAPDVTPEDLRNARFVDRLSGYYHGLYDTGL